MTREPPTPSNVSAPPADRRDSPRMRPSSDMYLHLGDGRSVPILDVSEKGLAVYTLALTEQSLQSIRFCTPGSKTYIECNGKAVWSGKSELDKQSGIEFVDMAENAREEIRRWISLAARADADADAVNPGADAVIAPVSDLPSQPAVQEFPNEVPGQDTFNYDKFFPSESDPSFSDLRASFPPREEVSDPYSVLQDNFFNTEPVIPATAIEATDTDSVESPEKIPDTAMELPGGKDALSFSKIFGARTPEAETIVVPHETVEDKPAAVKNRGNTISRAQPSISTPLWKPSEPKRHGTLTAWAAALGFIGGLGLASFLILGSFHFSKSGNAATHDVLQTSANGDGNNNNASDLTQNSEPSAPVQSGTDSTAPAIPLAGASSHEPTLSDDSSVSDDTGQPPAGDVENSLASNPQSSNAKKQITPNENLVPAESRQANQYAQTAPPANPPSDPPVRQAPSTPAGATISAVPPTPRDTANAPPSADGPRPPDTQAPKLDSPVARTSAAPASPADTANAPSSADSPRPLDSQAAPTLSGSVASASQFMGVQMPKTSGSEEMS